jgi:enoyl-CoA hydratase
MEADMRCELAGDVAVVRLEGGKANAMNEAFLDGLDRAFGEFESSTAKAAVITGYATYFSAGLDLAALAPMSRADLRAFLAKFHRAMLRVFRCSRPVVAAVNGHAIAGGCVLAMQADHRVAAAGAFKIGLNETQIGIGLPPVVVETMRLRLPPAAWNDVMLEGRLFTPQEARDRGLVDEIVAPERVESAALDVARRLASVPSAAYAHVKSAIRGPAIAVLERDVGPAHEAWLDTWFAQETRTMHAELLAKLAAKRS